MRYLRPINNFDLFEDDYFDDIFKPLMPKGLLMKTDIKESDGNIILEMEVPGYKKEDISIDFEDGYITVVAKMINKPLNKESKEQEKHEKYIRRERHIGTMTRKFYIGDIDEKDIKAVFDRGLLILSFPKESKKIEKKKQITIE